MSEATSIFTKSIARRLKIVKLCRELGVTPYMFTDWVFIANEIGTSADEYLIVTIDFMSRLQSPN